MKDKIIDFLIIWGVLQLAAIIVAAICIGISYLFSLLPSYVSWVAIVVPIILAGVLVHIHDKRKEQQ